MSTFASRAPWGESVSPDRTLCVVCREPGEVEVRAARDWVRCCLACAKASGLTIRPILTGEKLS